MINALQHQMVFVSFVNMLSTVINALQHQRFYHISLLVINALQHQMVSASDQCLATSKVLSPQLASCHQLANDIFWDRDRTDSLISPLTP